MHLPPVIITRDNVLRSDPLNCGVDPGEHEFEVRWRCTSGSADGGEIDVQPDVSWEVRFPGIDQSLGDAG